VPGAGADPGPGAALRRLPVRALGRPVPGST
jgi:hypothetical protein